MISVEPSNNLIRHPDTHGPDKRVAPGDLVTKAVGGYTSDGPGWWRRTGIVLGVAPDDLVTKATVLWSEYVENPCRMEWYKCRTPKTA